MHIVIHLSNEFITEAISQLLVTNGYDTVVVGGESTTNGITPDVLLVDVASVRHTRPAQYQNAKVLLMDTGTEPEKLCATLLSYRVHGVLSPHTEFPLLKKALTAVSEGKLWIDNGAVKTLLHDTGNISRKGEIGHITSREQEIIDCICLGLSNNEIARRLALSPHTVKAHLSNVFKKLNVTSRSKLMALATHRPRELSV